MIHKSCVDCVQIITGENQIHLDSMYDSSTNSCCKNLLTTKSYCEYNNGTIQFIMMLLTQYHTKLLSSRNYIMPYKLSPLKTKALGSL